jgi:hypothetical protein
MKTPFHILAAFVASVSFAFSQGSLTPPPGAPAPVMKTLDQIEARKPIPATVTPGPGPYFIITQPGSYYLTGNITVTSADAIRITALSDVSIDLNGFTIKSTQSGGSSGAGVLCNSSFSRLTVSNGQITNNTLQNGFYNGIVSTGILSEALIRNVSVWGMSSTGIFLDMRGIVENCSAVQCGGVGIFASNGSVRNSITNSNTGHGVDALGGTVTSCVSSQNGQDGIQAIGGVVTQCRVMDNSNNGIHVGAGVASQCVAIGNDPDAVATDYQIKVQTGGQRSDCVPATEAGSP